ncbi:MAG: DUF1080 domain-containing protein [Verrucomicrobia bacterium]|nr:DUF1080 domain-containing protein [Verrucomicrobiota bacterium]
MKPNTVSTGATFALLLSLTACCCVGKRAGTPSEELFNGRDLSGWNHVSANAATPLNAVWTVQNGIIVCQGDPVGFLYSERAFTNFRLLVEYRWAPGQKPGNSGIFSRIAPPIGALPRCVEVQLMHGNAGDVLGLQGRTIEPNQARFFAIKAHPLAGDIAGVKKTQDHEKPPGEWNRVELLAQDGNYTVWVNGELVNEVSGVEIVPGPIGLQSEGGELHFRRVTITPL